MKPLRIGLVAQKLFATGNDRTISRIAAGLESGGHFTQAFNTMDQEGITTLSNMVYSNQLDLLVGLHAYHAGSILVQYRRTIPYVIILGGTDANVMVHDPERKRIMAEALEHAQAIVCFTAALEQHLRTHFANLFPPHVLSEPSSPYTSASVPPSAPPLSSAPPSSSAPSSSSAPPSASTVPPVSCPPPSSSCCPSLPRVSLIPQAAECPEPDPQASLHSLVGCGPHDRIFLLPAGIRAVKDPEFVVEVMQQWHARDPSVWLAIVGPQLEMDAMARLTERLSRGAGVCYLGSATTAVLHGLMRQSVAVLNTSLEEGMCGALLEAMLLLCPVLARRNDGNEAVIQHGVTGFLFDTPEEFLEVAMRLVSIASESRKACDEVSHEMLRAETSREMKLGAKRSDHEAQHHKMRKIAWGVESLPASSGDLQKLIAAARTHVLSVHSLEAEARAYSELCVLAAS